MGMDSGVGHRSMPSKDDQDTRNQRWPTQRSAARQESGSRADSDSDVSANRRAVTQAVVMNGLSGWTQGPAQLPLPRGQVHVWRIQPPREEQDEHHFRKLLDCSELRRADSFHFEKDRLQFIVVRGFLKRLLSRYLHLPGRELEFSYNKYGKPGLPVHLNEPDLQFSVAHSHEYGLVALSCDAQIGVDLEFERSGLQYLPLAKSILSAAQFAEFLCIPPAVQGTCFYRLWTRKEAVSKAIGIGLSLPFSSFDVSLQWNESPEIIQLDSPWGPAEQWALDDIEVDSKFAAALAINCRGRSVHLFDW